jgi:hypothetical protein
MAEAEGLGGSKAQASRTRLLISLMDYTDFPLDYSTLARSDLTTIVLVHLGSM